MTKHRRKWTHGGAGSGQSHEGQIVRDEEQAYAAITLHNFRVREEKREADESARRLALRASITLPKLKFMGQK